MMSIRGRWALVFIGISLSLGSFADEAAQVTFALRLADHTSSVSILLAAGLIGGMLSGPIAPMILQRIGPRKAIPAVFLLQSILIAVASLANQFWSYVVVSLALGSTGSLQWGAIMVAIQATQTTSGTSIVSTGLRNRCGTWVTWAARLSADCCTAWPGVHGAVAAGIVGVGRRACHRAMFQGAGFFQPEIRSDAHARKAEGPIRPARSLSHSRRHPCGRSVADDRRADIHAQCAVDLSSSHRAAVQCRDLRIRYQRVECGADRRSRGFSGMLARFGDAAGASIAASIIGFGILWLALSDAAWIIMCATFLIGSANGIQNALTASFMMKAIDPQRRVNLMPAYIFCIRLRYFSAS